MIANSMCQVQARGYVENMLCGRCLILFLPSYDVSFHDVAMYRKRFSHIGLFEPTPFLQFFYDNNRKHRDVFVGRAADRGQRGTNCPRASSSKGPHTAKYFRSGDLIK